MRRSASCRDDVAVCNARVALVGAAIAMVPAFLWWLLLSAVSDPDEGANIGGGIVGVLVIATSSVAALAFVGRELVGSVTEASGRSPTRAHLTCRLPRCDVCGTLAGLPPLALAISCRRGR